MRFDFPEWLNPVLLSLGPIQLTWYALAYMVGLIAGWQIVRWRVRADGFTLTPKDIDDYVIYALLGVIVGGRVGNFAFGWGGGGSFWEQLLAMVNPVQRDPVDGSITLAISGMSFHGGFLGVVLATLIFWLRRGRRFSLWQFADYLSLVAPIGLFLGRIANFINRELYGRVVGDGAWIGVSFYPEGTPPWAAFRQEACLASGSDPALCREFFDLSVYRHPSQLYEAAGEGLLLFAVLLVLYRLPAVRRRPGFMTGVFIAGYGLVRTLVEYVRSFNSEIGLNALGLTRSQELSVPMILVGLVLIFWTLRRALPPRAA